MGVWIEREVVKRRRIQQEREERLLMLKQMSTQQTGESKQWKSAISRNYKNKQR